MPTEPIAWPQDKPLRASVKNFGYGGANAHVILERVALHNGLSKGTSAVQDQSTGQKGTSCVFVVSSKDTTASQEMVKNLATYVRKSLKEIRSDDAHRSAPLSLDSLAYNLSERQSRFPMVAVFRANNLAELADRLVQTKLISKPAHGTKQPRLGFEFNGQGAQWHAMGREFIANYPEFGAFVKKADECLRDFGADWPPSEEPQHDETTTRVHETNISQPINVALQLCLVDLLQSWNITPSVITSHSSGEIAAAYSADILLFKEALAVVYHRGELAAEFQQRLLLEVGMLATGLGPQEAKEYLTDSVTLSGDLEALDQVAAKLQIDGVLAAS